MADQDEDWKKFLESTEDDPDEVETPDEGEDETEDKPGDPKKKPDKSEEVEGDDDPDAGKDDPDENEDDDPDEDDESAGKKKSDEDVYKPRLKQFLNEDGTLNAEKIEKSYVESGKQAVELNKKVEAIEGRYNDLLKAIKAKPDVAKALFGEEGAKKLAADSAVPEGDPEAPTHPLLQHLEAQMTNTSKAQYNEFVEAHPEAVTDPEKARLIGSFLKTHGAVYRQEHNGEIPSMKESLEAAYRYYGWDLEIKDKEDVATAAKRAAATRGTPQGGRQATKKEISQGEEFFAKKLGVKLKS